MKIRFAIWVFTLCVSLVVAQSAFPQVAEANSERDYATLRLDEIVEALRLPEPTQAQQEQWIKEFKNANTVCPGVDELTAFRNLVARQVQKAEVRKELVRKIKAGFYKDYHLQSVSFEKIVAEGLSVSEAYIVKRELGAKEDLVRCRFQAGWAASILAQTPSGQRYMALLGDLFNKGYLLQNSVTDYFIVNGGDDRALRDILRQVIIPTGWSMLDYWNQLSAALYAGALAIGGASVEVLIELGVIPKALGRLFQKVAAYGVVTTTVLMGLQRQLLEAARERLRAAIEDPRGNR